MSDERASQCDLVKSAVLGAYELRPEDYCFQYSELKKIQGHLILIVSSWARNQGCLINGWLLIRYSHIHTVIVDLIGH